MGGTASSQNYINGVTTSTANVLQSTANNMASNASNSAVYVVEGGVGDVVIDGLNTTQSITVSSSAVFKSVQDNSSVMNIANQMQQKAASMVSGLNLGNYSDTSNTVNICTNMAMDVTQNL